MWELSIADLYWAEDQLKRLTYKPGWTMEMYAPHGTFGEPGVLIEFFTEDTYNPGKQIRINSRERIPTEVVTKKNEGLFIRYVQDALLRVERHESQEWLKRDGIIFDNPHKERK